MRAKGVGFRGEGSSRQLQSKDGTREKIFRIFPESQCQNMALTAVHEPCSLDLIVAHDGEVVVFGVVESGSGCRV
jgi:hypothetical protein